MRVAVTSALRHGLAAPARHLRLVVAVYLAATLPAMLWVAWVVSALDRALAYRPLAEGLLGPRATSVWAEFVLSSSYQLGPAYAALPIFALFAWVLQQLVAGGTVRVLLEESATTRTPRAFWLGMGRCFWRFVRAGFVFLLALVPVVLLAGGGFAGASAAARAAGDERWRYGLGLVVVLVAYGLFAFLALAYDLVRIAAADSGRGSMFRGYLRALRWVLRRPGKLLLLHFSFFGILILLQALYLILRMPLTPAGVVGIVGVVVLQQGLTLGRAWLQVSFWAAKVQVFQRAGSPSWAGPADW